MDLATAKKIKGLHEAGTTVKASFRAAGVDPTPSKMASYYKTLTRFGLNTGTKRGRPKKITTALTNSTNEPKADSTITITIPTRLVGKIITALST